MHVKKIGIDNEKGPNGDQFQEILKIARGFHVMLLPKETDAHYAGIGIKQGDAERVILWFKPVGSEKYRVIYADLSVRESDEPPKVADATKLSN